MGTTELLKYLEKLEIGLSSFSYEELNTFEAGKLKRTFDEFKNDLEGKVFGSHPSEELEVIYEEIGISKPKTDSKTDYRAVLKRINQLLKEFDESELNLKQNTLLRQLKLAVKTSDENPHCVERRLGAKENERINLEPLWEECMFQMDLMEELARLYKQNIFEFVGKTKIHLQSGNVRSIDFSCQKIEPSLRMLRCHSLLEITEQMSMVCKSDNDFKHLNFLYNEFLQEYPKVEKLLNKKILLLQK
ncbi:hypothetical protein ACOKFD_02845 [Flagellimonas sp. S174]|uniref:hypothetical protein n=1 Tax=Flagellimonas sp. S174 TaxID=3410790 RepID=UPI003BF5BEA8